MLCPLGLYQLVYPFSLWQLFYFFLVSAFTSICSFPLDSFLFFCFFFTVSTLLRPSSFVSSLFVCLHSPRSLTVFLHFVPPLSLSVQAGNVSASITVSKAMLVSHTIHSNLCHQTRKSAIDLSLITLYLFLAFVDMVDLIHMLLIYT